MLANKPFDASGSCAKVLVPLNKPPLVVVFGPNRPPLALLLLKRFEEVADENRFVVFPVFRLLKRLSDLGLLSSDVFVKILSLLP